MLILADTAGLAVSDDCDTPVTEATDMTNSAEPHMVEGMHYCIAETAVMT